MNSKMEADPTRDREGMMVALPEEMMTTRATTGMLARLIKVMIIGDPQRIMTNGVPLILMLNPLLKAGEINDLQ